MIPVTVAVPVSAVVPPGVRMTVVSIVADWRVIDDHGRRPIYISGLLVHHGRPVGNRGPAVVVVVTVARGGGAQYRAKSTPGDRGVTPANRVPDDRSGGGAQDRSQGLIGCVSIADDAGEACNEDDRNCIFRFHDVTPVLLSRFHFRGEA
jgi:hypothetical protein